MLAGQKLGIKEVDEGIWLASFMHYDLRYFDLEQKTLQPKGPIGSPGMIGNAMNVMASSRSPSHPGKRVSVRVVR